MRCGNCNRFVSFDEPEVEIAGEVAAKGILTADVRIVLKCVDCGTELKEASLFMEEEYCLPCSCEHTVDEVEIVAEPSERYETKDKKGKPIKNTRYQKHFYGADIIAEVKCTCGETVNVIHSLEEQASSFDELV